MAPKKVLSAKVKPKAKFQSERDADELSEGLKTVKLESKPKKKKIIELAPEEPDEEPEQIEHMCGECGNCFLCKDGRFSKDGKRFKCSCLKEKDPETGENFYFDLQMLYVGKKETR